MANATDEIIARATDANAQVLAVIERCAATRRLEDADVADLANAHYQLERAFMNLAQAIASWPTFSMEEWRKLVDTGTGGAADG